MKTTMLLQLAIAVILFFNSCSETTDLPGEVGVIENGQPVLKKDKTTLLANWNKNLSSQASLKAELKDVEMISVEGNYYLRAKGESYTSTILLEKAPKSGRLIALGITCTSQSCSTSEGCLPVSKTKCSNCTYNDCTKSVSSFAMTSDK